MYVIKSFGLSMDKDDVLRTVRVGWLGNTICARNLVVQINLVSFQGAAHDL